VLETHLFWRQNVKDQSHVRRGSVHSPRVLALSSRSIYFGIKRSKLKVTSHKIIAGVGLRTLVSAGFV